MRARTRVNPPTDWFDVSVADLRRKLLAAILVGQIVPFLVTLYIVLAFVWPGGLASASGWRVVLLTLLAGAALLMAAGSAVVLGVAKKVSTLIRALRAVNLPDAVTMDDDELTNFARRVNLLLREQREKDTRLGRLEYQLRKAREDAAEGGERIDERELRSGRPYVGRALFDFLLGLEVARAARYHRTFSVAVMSFSPTDRSLPEEVVEKAQQWVVRTLPDYVRQSDVGYHRAPAEVALLLPEADEHQAGKFAHRVCSSVEAHPYVGGERIGGLRMRAYCGLATYPADGDDPDQLLGLAATRLGYAREGPSSVVGRI
jgi:GGDEF domain-containing protein